MRAGRLAADALAHGGKGRVVSIHRRAVNLTLEGGAVVSLLSADTPLHPWAIGGEIRLSDLEVGGEVEVNGGRLRVGGIEIGVGEICAEDLCIRRRPTQLLEIREVFHSASQGPGVRTPSPCRGTACRALGLARQAPTEEQDPPDFEPWEREITNALSDFSNTSDLAALARLVGLGGGLTPSGDDVIVGALAALDLLSLAVPSAADVRENLVKALPLPLTEHTPRLSAQMLTAAVDGQYPESLVRLCGAMTDGNSGAVQEAAAVVFGLGHRSGAEMLRGFSAALEGQGAL
jgi:Protein of unknown function (DUF2877)